jgi:hypothetical protein
VACRCARHKGERMARNTVYVFMAECSPLLNVQRRPL